MPLVLDLSGQVAIVSGGGTGIGLAIARELSKAGADIVICSRNMEHLQKGVEEVKAASGKRCLAIPIDVRKPEEIDKLVEQTMAEFGRIDILVNNAGGAFKVELEKLSVNGWDTVINLNLRGTFLFSQAVGKVMIQQKKGNIINISSIAGLTGDPFSAHYGASKAGIINFTKTLSWEWAKHNIRVNCIAPGPILVDAYIDLLKKRGIAEAPKSPFAMGRFGQPSEIGQIVVFLASDASSFITGETICASGGPQLAGDL